jgi:hypothetical protein
VETAATIFRVENSSTNHSNLFPPTTGKENASALKMETTGSFKTLILLYQTTRRKKPGDNNFHTDAFIAVRISTITR